MKPNPLNPEKISPSALYTSHIWVRNRLSPEVFSTPQGRSFYRWMLPIEMMAKLMSVATLEQMLVARHKSMDALVQKKLQSDDSLQVVELACGLSTRSLRLQQAFPNLKFIEADLPAMADSKREIWKSQGNPRQDTVYSCDLLKDQDFDRLAQTLDTNRGIIVLLEGVLSYFSKEQVSDIMHRVYKFARRFPQAYVLCDAHFASNVGGVRGTRLFQFLQSLFCKESKMQLPWQDAGDVEELFGKLEAKAWEIHSSRKNSKG